MVSYSGMKKDIHPEWHPEAKVIVNGETVMTVGSTQPELQVEIWSGTHPFYTGKQKLVDTAHRVEKFQARIAKKDEVSADRVGKKAKKVRAEARKKQAKKIKAEEDSK